MNDNPLGLQTPHDDEINWDAHDRVLERHYRMQEADINEFVSKSKRRNVFVILLLIGVLLLVGWFYLTKQPERHVTQSYELRGETYVCTHYQSGAMDCHLDGDEDVGFGRTQ